MFEGFHSTTIETRDSSVDSGHHMAEEAPEQLAAALTGFFGARG